MNSITDQTPDVVLLHVKVHPSPNQTRKSFRALHHKLPQHAAAGKKLTTAKVHSPQTGISCQSPRHGTDPHAPLTAAAISPLGPTSHQPITTARCTVPRTRHSSPHLAPDSSCTGSSHHLLPPPRSVPHPLSRSRSAGQTLATNSPPNRRFQVSTAPPRAPFPPQFVHRPACSVRSEQPPACVR
jgi:hypothetical protein